MDTDKIDLDELEESAKLLPTNKHYASLMLEELELAIRSASKNGDHRKVRLCLSYFAMNLRLVNVGLFAFLRATITDKSYDDLFEMTWRSVHEEVEELILQKGAHAGKTEKGGEQEGYTSRLRQAVSGLWNKK